MYQRLKLLLSAVIASLTKRLLGPNVLALLVQTRDGVFAVSPEDNGVGRQLRKSGAWAPDEIERLKNRITPDSRVLVVGAHIGTLAIPISRLCRSVVAVEANPVTYALLVQNISLNSASNCTPVNIGASDRTETIRFLLNRANSGGSKRAPRRRHFAYYYDKPKEISVPASRLDDYLDGREFDVIVMDIEGSEYFALLGMQKLLSACKVLVVEFLPHHLRHVSDVTVEQFLSTLTPHFNKLTVPPSERAVVHKDFLPYLQAMYDRAEGHDGIIFEK